MRQLSSRGATFAVRSTRSATEATKETESATRRPHVVDCDTSPNRVVKGAMMRRFLFLLCLVFMLTAVPLSAVALAAPGDLDTMFGTNGVAHIDLGAGSDVALGMVVQVDGCILIVCAHRDPATSKWATYLMRRTASGEPDSAFGSEGRVELPWALDVSAYQRPVVRIMIQPLTGRIILAQDSSMLAYTPDGSLDTSFGSSGSLVAQDMAPDGSFVGGGSVSTNGELDVAVFRFTPDGSPDASFGIGGVITVNVVTGGREYASAVAVDHLQRIVVAGSVESAHFCLRLLPSGALDASFGKAGIVIPPWQEQWNSIQQIAERSDGKLLFIEVKSGDMFRVWLRRASGAFETGFAHFQTTGSWSLLANDSVAAAGSYDNGYPSFHDFVVRRYTRYGFPDETFAPKGKVNIDFSSSDTASAVAVRPGGQLVVAGEVLATGGASVQTSIIIVQLRGGSRSGLATRLVSTPSSSVKLRLKSGRATLKTSGRLGSNGTPLVGCRLVLKRSANGRTWVKVSSLTTAFPGIAEASVKLTRRGTYFFRWSFAGTASYVKSVSRVTKVVVQ